MTGVHHLPDCGTDDLHFIHRQTVASGKVTWRAARNNVAFDVRPIVADAIKPARGGLCAAISAWLHEKRGQFVGREVAGINPLICFAEKDCSAFGCSPVAVLPSSVGQALLGRQIGVALFPTISALLSRAVARPAFIRQPKRPARVFQEDFRRRWQLLLASIAKAMAWLGSYSAGSRHGLNHDTLPTLEQDGPHWELPWEVYPR